MLYSFYQILVPGVARAIEKLLHKNVEGGGGNTWVYFKKC